MMVLTGSRLVLKLSSGLLAATVLGSTFQGAVAEAAAPPDSPPPLAEAVRKGQITQQMIDGVHSKGGVDVTVGVRIGSVLTSVKEKKDDRDRVQTLQDGAEHAKDRVVHRLRRFGDVVENFEGLPVLTMHVESEQALLALQNDPEVEFVSIPEQLEVTSMDPLSPGIVGQPPVITKGINGNGTYVVVLDTGVWYTNPDFGGCGAPLATAPHVPTGANCKIAWVEDFAPEDFAMDQHCDPQTGFTNAQPAHGTNVSGIVAGMAPGTKLIVLDVLNGCSVDQAGVTNAIKQVLNWKKTMNIVAVNMSFGGGKYTPTDATCTDNYALKSLRAAGILPVVSSGNNAYVGAVSHPACVPEAVTVGATYTNSYGTVTSGKMGDPDYCQDLTTVVDKVACFSNSSSQIDLLAPGAWITAAGVTMAGTSQASPHVAGAVALIAQACPVGGPDYWETSMKLNGKPIYDRDGALRPRLDIGATVLSGSCFTQAPTPSVTSNSTLSTSVSVNVCWKATDAQGISAYNVWIMTNNGAWVQQTLSSLAATCATFPVTPGTTYQVAVSARDTLGNVSPFVYSAKFTALNVTESNTAISYVPAWSTVTYAPANGGTMKTSGTAGATAQLTFTGQSIAWVAATGSNRGVAEIWIDNTLFKTVDTYSLTSAGAKVVFSAYWPQSGSHTIKVKVVGTATRPYVDVDSFIVLG